MIADHEFDLGTKSAKRRIEGQQQRINEARQM
jgi:hypothetical protein